MVDHDMFFKAGLMLSVLVLAGLFGSSLVQSMGEETNKMLDRITSELRSVFMTMRESGSGSSLSITFHDRANDDSTLLSFPGYIDGKPFLINFMPDMVYIESSGRRSIVVQGDRIIPGFPLVENEGSLDLGGSSGRMSGGFAIQTPCTITLTCAEDDDRRGVFVHPAGIENDGLIGDLEPIMEVMGAPGIISPGWELSASLSGVQVMFIDERILALAPLGNYTNSGTCPVLIMIEGSPRIERTGPKTTEKLSSITFHKQAALGTDGIIELSFGIYVE
jgi:hypothetical protein